jgi:hypothetical protein
MNGTMMVIATALLALLGVATTPAHAATFTVTSTSDSGPGSLREALALAADGDTIDATGVSGTILLTSGHLVVQHGVTITGPGPATLTIDGNGASRGFLVSAPGKTVVIAGLTITNGRVPPQEGGGAILGVVAHLALSNCALTGNVADRGGAIEHLGSLGFARTLTLVDCTLDGNSAAGFAGGQGGAIYNDQGVVRISRSRLSGNSADGGAICCGIPPAGRGGAIFNDRGEVTLEHSTLSGNAATRLASPLSNEAPRGGGIYNAGAGAFGQAALRIVDSTISDNEAQTNIGLGGGIYNDGAFSGSATLEIVASTLSGNAAGDGGGGIYSDGSDGGLALVQIAGSTVSGNTADQIGGGIRHVGTDGDAHLEISASTFVHNSAAAGGSIELFGGSASLEVATTIFAAGAQGVTIRNDGGTVTSHGSNLSSDGAGGVLTASTDLIDTDPMLGPLQDNGGATFTHELLAGSPAIDAVAVGAACASTDQRGVPRPQGTACDVGAFERSSVVPTLTRFSPLKGAPGITVIITGTAFTGATSVTFNGIPASYTVTSATRITATVPAGATTGPIGVGTAFGTVTSAGTFTVAPRITGFVPQSGEPGASVVITGSNFTGATAVRFHGIAAAFHVDSSTQITATVPAGATTGPLAVTTPGGTATSTGTYTVGPRIKSFTPSSTVVGASVVINGANFTGAFLVTFNGSSPAIFTVNSATRITAIVPDSATSGPIVVLNAGGFATSTKALTVHVAPTVTGISPDSGGVGTPVMVSGTSFTGATAVTFTGRRGSFTVDSDGQITAIVPAGATSGPIAVTTRGGTATSAASFLVAPRITSFTPSSGVIGATVIVNGANFTGAPGVTFNGTPSSNVMVDSPTRLRAVVPAGATTGKIAVSTGAGTATSAGTFSVRP